MLATSTVKETQLLAKWVRRSDLVQFMVSFHGRTALVDMPVYAQTVADALESEAIQRMQLRDRLWQEHCEKKRAERHQMESGIGSSSSSCWSSEETARSDGACDDTATAVVSCSGGGDGVVNSRQHARNISEVFTRYSIFINITSFL